MDEAQLERREGQFEDDNEATSWVEYWDGDEMVHRSVRVHLKKPMISVSEIGGFS
jgi:hypothetical protein